MFRARPALVPLTCVSALLVVACQNDSQSPRSRPEPPAGQDAPETSTQTPLDLVYVCGNKFLAINATTAAVQVTYRVVGTDESGSLTLRPGTEDDEGHSETELKTAEQGVVELYRDEERVARRRNNGLPCGPAPMSSSLAALGPAESGSWTAPFAWPIVALNIALLPTGKVLAWGHGGDPQVWNPATGDFTQVAEPAELFCSGLTLLGDGRVLVSGGHITNGHGLPDINIFDPSSESWSRSTPMQRGRWYPSNTTLAGGEVVILAGKDQDGVRVPDPEVWSSGGLRVLSTASRPLPYYPRAFLAPNGKLFYAGEEQTSRYLDPTGTGSWTTVDDRLYGVRDYGAAVMYDAGKILYVGGGRTTNTAEIIDLNSATPAWQWTGSMASPRRHLNATVLPTGEVLVTGGSSGTAFNDVALAVHTAELWNPASGTWKTLASNSVNRTYHATSLLLPDGRVLHSGSGDGAGAPNERNAELFSPPYLFRGARPVITGAPTQVAWGTSFRVTTPDAADISKVSLIRLGAVTHAFDMNQRFQSLSFDRQSGALSIAMPSSRNRTPPGHYLLFLLNGNGVPSVAKIVKVGSESDPAPVNAPPVASFTADCTARACNFTDASSDGDGAVNGWSWDFGDGGSATSQNPSHTYESEGSYQVILTATDDDGATGAVTQTVTITPPPPNTPPTAGFSQTCHGFTCSFTDASTDDGTVKGWSWHFGDGGSATGQNPSHTFAGEGSYEVTLLVTDNDDATGTVTQTVTVTLPPPNVAPAAEFSQICDGFTCSFTDGSTDDDGTVKGWSWDFGDGGSATTQNPSHTYAEGSYEVTLVATDNEEATGTVTQTVVVTPPPPNTPPTAEFTLSCAGLSCSFSDASSDEDGTIRRWSWTFGDGGSASTSHPTHTYSAAGSYDVTLAATDDDDATGSVTVTVTVAELPNAPPSAVFTQNCDALSCQFTDGSTDDDGTVNRWSWDFGDGGSATGQNPSHSYASQGSYQVTLVATDNDDATGTVTRTVTVSPPPPLNASPVAAFSSSCSGLSCTFTDASTDGDGTVTARSWDLGDGAHATTTSVVHAYASGGTYPVMLTVTDDDGATNQKSTPVTVVAPTTSNAPPAAAFTYSCTGLTCRFSDRSTDADGIITAWKWTFGNGMTGAVANPSRTYAAAGTYTVTMRVTDDDGAINQIAVPITVGSGTANRGPVAAFTQSCTGLTCRFTDRSTDGDGTLAAWKWTFGNGTSSTNRNPSRTYASAGTYTVTLRVTDNKGATGQTSVPVTVKSGATSIVLSVTGWVDATKQYMKLIWSGARGTTVDIYRNGTFFRQEANDGRYTNSRLLPGLSKYTYKVCELGTTVCSSNTTVVF
jgi:PKD repeat protein